MGGFIQKYILYEYIMDGPFEYAFLVRLIFVAFMLQYFTSGNTGTS